jgi:hypothetical protein
LNIFEKKNFFFGILILVPKIIFLGPPASGRHTIGKLLQKKFNTVLIEAEDVLRDASSKLKDKLPSNPNIVWRLFYEILFEIFI